MKIKNILWIVAVLLLASCARRKTLSDTELAIVFRDAYLANSYSLDRGLKLDSLKLYEPIFQHYGYTTEDVQYTIGSFSTRKSARLSDIVERSIQMLEERGKVFDREVAILDTVNNIAIRESITTIYKDSLLEFRSLKDSADMVIVIEDIEEGNYRLEFDYLIDTLDTSKKRYIAMYWLEDNVDGEESLKPRNKSMISLTKKQIANYNQNIKVDAKASRLVIVPLSVERSKATHYATAKNLTLKRVPNSSEAQKILFDRFITANIFDDELLFQPKDSI